MNGAAGMISVNPLTNTKLIFIECFIIGYKMILFCVRKTRNKKTLNKSSYVRNEFLPLHFKNILCLLIDYLVLDHFYFF